MQTPESNGFDFGDIPAWIALALSLYTSLRQTAQERKTTNKEILIRKISKVEEFEKSINEARAYALAYWLVDEHTGSKEAPMLVAKLREISRNATKHTDILWPEAVKDAMNLRKSMTGEDFQQANRKAYPPDHTLVKQFMKTTSQMLEKAKDTRDALLPK